MRDEREVKRRTEVGVADRNQPMIARIWRGWATPENADAYEAHFRTSVLIELRGVEGFVAAQLLRRTDGDEVELMAVTYWDSMAAIRRFAGEDYEVAVVAPAAQAVLSRYEERVVLYEVEFTTDAS
jgi:heme-degrading monooxygenase HmoA